MDIATSIRRLNAMAAAVAGPPHSLTTTHVLTANKSNYSAAAAPTSLSTTTTPTTTRTTLLAPPPAATVTTATTITTSITGNGVTTPIAAASPYSSPVSGGVGVGGRGVTTSNSSSRRSNYPSNNFLPLLLTPKKDSINSALYQALQERVKTPSSACELRAQRLECATTSANIIKERYLISTEPTQLSPAAAAKTPASYRHLIDLTSSNLKCTDIFTGERYLCKIINEPLYKVQRAYFQLKQDEELSRSTIYGHLLVRGVHDIVPLSKQRTYIIIAKTTSSSPATANATATNEMGWESNESNTGNDNEQQSMGCGGVVGEEGVYEDLHTYIRNKRRLCEEEARALFHQICQTVLACHQNGIILRDLKLKRFFFIDEERTKLQYESLEGSMILDNSADDTLSDKIGCPLYTAPELLCPNPTYRGKPADMWSLGVILYTMLVGQYPFYEKGNCNLITVIRHCNVQIPGSLSRPVKCLLLSLLRKNYEERTQAEQIFQSTWLKEQRPYYMSVPVDVCFSSDEEEEEDEEEDEDEVQYDDTDIQADDVEMLNENFSPAISAVVEPLDYSRTTLQMAWEERGGDVEMG